MFSRTGFSNLLNKIQFTFEVVPCLISGLFRRFFRRCAPILVQCYKGWGVGGGGMGGGGVGEEGGEGGGKSPHVKTRSDQLPTDGPEHTTRPKGHHSGQG